MLLLLLLLLLLLRQRLVGTRKRPAGPHNGAALCRHHNAGQLGHVIIHVICM